MKAILFVSALALVGCSKKSDESSSSSADPCAAAINSAVDKMVSSRGGDAPPAMKEIAEKLRTLMTEHCRADKWPADIVSCFASATDQPSIKQCRQKLPPDLAQKLQTDIIKAMSAGARDKMRERMGGGGMGMGGPHGANPHAGMDMGGGSGGGSGGGAATGSAAPPEAPAGSGSAK